MIPNLLPCALLYGGMAALGRPLTVASAMIGTVFLGLVVDDSVHVLYLFRRARAAGESSAAAVATALRRAGRAVTVTSVALCVGFAACWFGRMETTREFGALASATVLAAFVSNLVVLPALLLGAGGADAA
jgi:predicted RND superfamily exporter protein